MPVDRYITNYLNTGKYCAKAIMVPLQLLKESKEDIQATIIEPGAKFIIDVQTISMIIPFQVPFNNLGIYVTDI